MLSVKLRHALALGALFYVVSSPFTYRMVDNVVGRFLRSVLPQSAGLFRLAEGSCPTYQGLVVHSLVFALVAYYLMQ
jgi:hypothetical protein